MAKNKAPKMKALIGDMMMNDMSNKKAMPKKSKNMKKSKKGC